MLRGDSFQRFKCEPANALKPVFNQETCIDSNLQSFALMQRTESTCNAGDQEKNLLEQLPSYR